MEDGFRTVRGQLQALAPLHVIDGVLVQDGLPDDPFEQQYLQIRRKEGRLYTDAQVRSLPRPGGALGNTLEWQVRALSSSLLVQHLQAHTGHGAILELGCGNGWLSHLLAQSLQREVCGVDVNRTELTQAARVFGHDARLTFVAADIHTLVLPRDVFDVIVLPACVQYFSDPAALVSRLLGCLREGGELHILDSPCTPRRNAAGKAPHAACVTSPTWDARRWLRTIISTPTPASTASPCSGCSTPARGHAAGAPVQTAAAAFSVVVSAQAGQLTVRQSIGVSGLAGPPSAWWPRGLVLGNRAHHDEEDEHAQQRPDRVADAQPPPALGLDAAHPPVQPAGQCRVHQEFGHQHRCRPHHPDSSHQGGYGRSQ